MKSQAKNVKAIVTDVDGVLTDGGIYYDENGNEFKKFNVKDGQIIKNLKDNGIILGVITGRTSKSVDRRVHELDFDFYRSGVENKILELANFLKKFGLKPDDVAYIGDDINDLKLLKSVGFSSAPTDSRYYIRNTVDYVTSSKGGEGAFRDLADYILEAKGKFREILSK
jgi:3-deoxy-D-manno-octulosonate 8-phosphate phosphatase (KDO 8-P phosphatase)